MKKVLKVLPHAVIVMAGMMIVFFCIDRVNQPMGFMTNEFHKWLSLMLALASLGYSILAVAWQRRQERMENQRRARAAQAKRQTARPPQSAARAERPIRPVQGR